MLWLFVLRADDKLSCVFWGSAFGILTESKLCTVFVFLVSSCINMSGFWLLSIHKPHTPFLIVVTINRKHIAHDFDMRIRGMKEACMGLSSATYTQIKR